MLLVDDTTWNTTDNILLSFALDMDIDYSAARTMLQDAKLTLIMNRDLSLEENLLTRQPSGYTFEYISDMKNARSTLNGAYSVYIVHHNRTKRYMGEIAYVDGVLRMVTQEDLEKLDEQWAEIVRKIFQPIIDKYPWLNPSWVNS